MGLLDYICRDDNQVAYDVMQDEYGYIMQLGGIFPNMKTRKWRTLGVIHFSINVTMFVYMIVVYMITAKNITEDQIIFIQTLHFIILFVIGLFCLVPTTLQRSNLANAYHDIQNNTTIYDKEINTIRQSMKMQRKEKIKLFAIFVMISFTATIVVMAIVGPALDYYSGLTPTEIYNARGVSLNTLAPTWSPIGTHHWPGLIFASLVQIIASSELSILLVASNVLLTGFVEILKSEIDLLKHSLDELPNRAIRELRKHYGKKQFDLTKVTEQEMGRTYAFLLKQNVIHHIGIIQFFNRMKKVASVPMFIGYVFGGLIIAFSVTAVISGSTRYAPVLSAIATCVLEVLNMFYCSYCGDRLHEASDSLRLALYSTKWRTLRKQESTYIKIMMTMSQRELQLTGIGLITANFQTFSDVMNTAYSYCNLMYAQRSEQDN